MLTLGEANILQLAGSDQSQTLRSIQVLTDVENHSSLTCPMKILPQRPTGWAKPHTSSYATVMASSAATLDITQEGTVANKP